VLENRVRENLPAQSVNVDMVENNWNALELFIFDWGEKLNDRKMARKIKTT
jgi:hypothetical protein